MRDYKEISNDIGGNLRSYASGDGSISFSWERRGRGLGEVVTPTHISLWRREFKRLPKLEILNKISGAVLYTPVTRVDTSTLVIEGKILTYERDDTFTAEKRYIVYLKGEEDPYHVGNDYSLKVNFYLKNETEILRQEKDGVFS